MTTPAKNVQTVNMWMLEGLENLPIIGELQTEISNLLTRIEELERKSVDVSHADLKTNPDFQALEQRVRALENLIQTALTYT